MDDINSLRTAAVVAKVIESRPIHPDGRTIKAAFLIDHSLPAGTELYANSEADTPPVALPAVVDAEARRIRVAKLEVGADGEYAFYDIQRRPIFDLRPPMDGFKANSFDVFIEPKDAKLATHPAPASASEPATALIVCGPTTGCGKHYPNNLSKCPHCGRATGCSSASVAGASESLQAMADNARELGLGYETGESEELPLWALIYSALMHEDRKPKTVADFEAASKRVAEMLERRAAAKTLAFDNGFETGRLAALAKPAGQGDGEAAFKNFHRSLCARFGYVHDEKDWRRDLVSLEEHIAKQVAAPQTLVHADVERDAARDVLAERQRQINAEGWTHEHDDEHFHGGMARAAASYTLYAAAQSSEHPGIINWLNLCADQSWPWELKWRKRGEPRRMLVKAGALILAEIERLDRDAARQPSTDAEGGAARSIIAAEPWLKTDEVRDRLEGDR